MPDGFRIPSNIVTGYRKNLVIARIENLTHTWNVCSKESLLQAGLGISIKNNPYIVTLAGAVT